MKTQTAVEVRMVILSSVVEDPLRTSSRTEVKKELLPVGSLFFLFVFSNSIEASERKQQLISRITGSIAAREDLTHCVDLEGGVCDKILILSLPNPLVRSERTVASVVYWVVLRFC